MIVALILLTFAIIGEGYFIMQAILAIARELNAMNARSEPVASLPDTKEPK